MAYLTSYGWVLGEEQTHNPLFHPPTTTTTQPTHPPTHPLNTGLMAYLTSYGWVLGGTDTALSSTHHHYHHAPRLPSGHKDDGKGGSVEVLGVGGVKEEEEIEEEGERLRAKRHKAASAVATMRQTGAGVLGRLQISFKVGRWVVELLLFSFWVGGWKGRGEEGGSNALL